jgi:hypothetical protein
MQEGEAIAIGTKNAKSCFEKQRTKSKSKERYCMKIDHRICLAILSDDQPGQVRQDYLAVEHLRHLISCPFHSTRYLAILDSLTIRQWSQRLKLLTYHATQGKN